MRGSHFPFGPSSTRRRMGFGAGGLVRGGPMLDLINGVFGEYDRFRICGGRVDIAYRRSACNRNHGA
jgi:hypothetical protein